MVCKNSTEGLSGAIYTEPYDVELEQNGFLTYDRAIIKVPVEQMYKINSKLHRHFEEITK